MTEGSNRFTAAARRALAEAYESADRMGHGYIGSEHLLIGLLRETKGGLCPEAGRLEEEIEGKIGRGDACLLPRGMTPAARRILMLAGLEAGQNEIGVEEILRAIRREGQNGACRFLTKTEKERRDPSGGGTRREERSLFPEARTLPQSIARYGADLTALYEEGKLPPVVGREKETGEVIRILCRRTKNHPVLLGEPGVGKSAVAEKLAGMLAEGKAPPALCGKRIFRLDPAALLAGTRYRGDLEERMEALLGEIRARDDLILFVDEMHALSGAGGAEGSISLSELLKPALARGELCFLGADTYEEYGKYVEKDPALARRFSPVEIAEPGEEETEEILCGLRPSLEAHHGVLCREEAIRAAVKLAGRYLPERRFPDKAIDLLDEAACRVRLAGAARYGGGSGAAGLRAEREKAIRAGDYRGAGRLRERIGREIAGEEPCPPEKPAPALETTRADVEAIVSEKTGIPLSHLRTGERERLQKLEETLKSRVIGQDRAAESLCRALKRSRAGLGAPGRPVGSFLFTGPTGVGKTETAKALAAALFGEEKALLRFDMTEFGEENAVNRLIGAPPGYVGYGEGGELTGAIRRRPYAVILFDEIEKAHRKVIDLFLQILDDGRVTDGEGKRAHFEHAVLIFTANTGARAPGERRRMGFGFADGGDAEREEEILRAVKETFRPEFLGRLSAVVPFKALSRETLGKIAGKELGAIRDRAAEEGIAFSWSAAAAEALADRAEKSADGARGVRKDAEREAADRLAELILAGKKGIAARLDYGAEGFFLSPAEK